MNKALFNKILPHLIAVVVFLLVAIIYCRPALQGKVISQSDVSHWKGMNKQSIDFKEKTGHYPLWTNSLFSGMPTFLIGYDANNVLPWKVYSILTLGLPIPIQFFFLACICFYFLAMALRVNPYLGILGSLAFAYATYNPVIISVGHETKMWSIAFMPAVLASVLLIFDRKYWLGAALTALFTSAMVAMNHLQIDYYLFIAMVIMTIFFAIRWIREKQYKHLAMVAAFTIGGAIIGVAVNAVTLMTTYEYQKETIRGGGSDLSDTTGGNKNNSGLSKDYALSYSLKIAEPLVMMTPRIFGGSTGSKALEPEKSKTIEELQGFPQQLQQLPVDYYWGGLDETGQGTSGPPYLGAVICFLVIVAMVFADKKHKWWMFATCCLAVIMSWGSYFEGFNVFLFENLPFYNKFRAPSMILVVPQLLFPALAMLGLQAIIGSDNKPALMKQFKKSLYITAGVFAVLLLMYTSFDYNGLTERQIQQQLASANQPQLTELGNQYASALKQDRRSMFMGDIGKAFGFIAITALLILLLIRKTITPRIAIIGITALAFIDLMMVNVKYFGLDNYFDPAEVQEFPLTAADQQIKKDTGYYRVFNIDQDRFQENNTSYYHNSIGGYHAAKLKIYQDLIERQMSAQPNLSVLNMLNAKYFIMTDRQSGQKIAQQNQDALGAAWLVKNIRYVNTPLEEMNALNNFNPRDTAIVQNSFKSSIPFEPQWDSAASISLVKNNNDQIQYKFSASSNQFVVFSEIYYKAGWKALIDGKEAPIVKVNYVLRGLAVPSGQHNIEFKFEPKGYYTGTSITTVASILLLLLLAFSIFLEWRARKK
jgi:hypothetical protein